MLDCVYPELLSDAGLEGSNNTLLWGGNHSVGCRRPKLGPLTPGNPVSSGISMESAMKGALGLLGREGRARGSHTAGHPDTIGSHRGAENRVSGSMFL